VALIVFILMQNCSAIYLDKVWKMC